MATNNPSGTSSYNFVHTSPAAGPNYYRIQQRDMDGKSSWSKTVRLNFADAGKTILVYPNPVRQQKLTVVLPVSMNVKLYSTNGLLLVDRVMGSGINELELNKYAKGLYLLKAGEQTFKIVVE